MRRRLPVIFALACLACYAIDARDASAAGSHGSSSPPAPAPAPSGGSGSAHGGGGSHGGGSGSGGSARGGSSHGGSSRGGSSNGSGRSYGGGTGHGSSPAYGGGARGGGAGNSGGTRVHGSTAAGYVYRPPSQQSGSAAAAKAGTAEKVHEFRWACRGPGGVVYYSFAGPCEDSEEAPVVAQEGMARGQASGFENSTDYATDIFAVGIVPGAGTARVTDLPILTRNTEAVAPYSVILRDGMVFASVERPRQSGKMIVARDRSGNLFSIRASEVDLAATKPAAPAH